MLNSTHPFFKDIRPDFGLELITAVPGLLFYAKNTRGEYCALNHLYASHCQSSIAKCLGKTDFDIFPSFLAEYYSLSELSVMKKGKSSLNQVNLRLNKDGTLEWINESKIPLYTHQNAPAGLAVTLQRIDESSSASFACQKLAKAISMIRKSFHKQLSIPELANMSEMSVRQFQSKFKTAFGQSPQHFIIKTRILSACERLINKKIPITKIAVEVGFYDHSSFTRQFTKTMGITPLKYKKRHQQRMSSAS